MYDRKRLLVLPIIIITVLFVFASPSINALPGFSDGSGPTNISVTEFKKLESGCIDEIKKEGGSNIGQNGAVGRIGIIRTNNPDSNLSVLAERTSPIGSDMSTFRVQIESHGQERKTGCQTAVKYVVRVQTSGGSPEGVLPNEHGYRILWLTNGRFSGCSGMMSAEVSADCERFEDRPSWTWVNGT